MTKKIENEKFLLFTLTLMLFVETTDLMMVVPIGNLFMKDFSLNPQQFTFIISAYKFSAAALGILGILFIDRFDRKIALTFISIVFMIGILLCGLSYSYEMLIVARVITGGVGALIPALAISVIGDYIPYERRGKAIGILFLGLSMAGIAGVSFGLYLADLYTWHYAYFFLAIVSFLVIFLVVWGLPSMTLHLEKLGNPMKPLKIIKEIFLSPEPLKGLALEITLYVGSALLLIFLPSYMVRNLGIPQEEIKYIYLFGGILNTLSSPLIGKAADKFGKQPILIALILLMIIPIVSIMQINETSLLLLLVITSLFYVMVNGRFIPANAMVTATVKDEYRAGFMSINSSFQQLSSAIASLIIGTVLIENEDGSFNNFEVVGYVSIALCIVAVILAMKLRVKIGQGH